MFAYVWPHCRIPRHTPEPNNCENHGPYLYHRAIRLYHLEHTIIPGMMIMVSPTRLCAHSGVVIMTMAQKQSFQDATIEGLFYPSFV